MHLYLARHGETTWNVEKRVQGWGDSPLTKTGVRQAEALADRLARIPLAAVYASDLERARTTAQIVAGRHQLAVHSLPAFREMSWGEWEGMTTQEMSSQSPELWEAFVKKGRDELIDGSSGHESTTLIPGGESMALTTKRIYSGLDDIVARHTDSADCVLVVGHGGSLRFAFTHALGLAPTAHRRFHLDNTGLSCIDYTTDRPPRIRFINDTGHWQEEALEQL